MEKMWEIKRQLVTESKIFSMTADAWTVPN